MGCPAEMASWPWSGHTSRGMNVTPSGQVCSSWVLPAVTVVGRHRKRFQPHNWKCPATLAEGCKEASDCTSSQGSSWGRSTAPHRGRDSSRPASCQSWHGWQAPCAKPHRGLSVLRGRPCHCPVQMGLRLSAPWEKPGVICHTLDLVHMMVSSL